MFGLHLLLLTFINRFVSIDYNDKISLAKGIVDMFLTICKIFTMTVSDYYMLMILKLSLSLSDSLKPFEESDKDATTKENKP